MRNSTKLLAACSLLLIFVLNAHPQSQRAIADKIIAIVGDQSILQSDIDNQLLDMKRMGQHIPADTRCVLMRQAIVSKLLMQQAQKDSLPVSDQDVEAEMERRINAYVSSNSEISAGVEKMKENARPFFKERMLADAMQNKIVQNVRITPSEVKAFYDKIPKDSLRVFEPQYELCQIVVYPKPTPEAEQYLISQMTEYKKQLEAKKISFTDLDKKTDDHGPGTYEMNRNDKSWDPDFLAAAFRLKEGEISAPVKTKFGYHLIMMVRRNGDDATVRHFLRLLPVTYEDVKVSVDMLYQLRDEMIAKNIDFKDAASNFNEDKDNESTGYCLTNPDGSTKITLDQLDAPLSQAASKLKPRELSKPIVSESETGRKSVHLLYLQSLTDTHVMNLKDDYNYISSMAIEEKKRRAIEKWVETAIRNYDIMIDDAAAAECSELRKYGSSN